jgi:hypothetical protein
MSSDDADDDARTRNSDPNGAADRISAHPQQESNSKHTPGDWLDRLLTPQPVRLSLSLKRLLISQFTADTLRTLAYMKEQESPGLKARLRLSQASIEELAELLTEGRKPGLGWWSRHSEVAA